MISKPLRATGIPAVAFALLAVACSRDESAAPKRVPELAAEADRVSADDIPIAHTPPGGYGQTFPPPVLERCTEPLVAGAPDLRGIWKTLRAERAGQPVPAGAYIYAYVERIEQCGNRIVDMGGGTIADARADGTATNGVHDVSVFDYKTPVHAVASYEDGVFVLRPLLIPSIPVTFEKLEVTRRIDADGHMVWTRPDQGGLTITLERIGSATDTYTRTDTLRPEGGPPPGTPMWRYRLRMLWTLLTSS